MKRLSERSRRIARLLVAAGAVVLAPFCYFVFVKLTGRGLPCLVLSVTGFYCPACGITRMMVALLSGDILAAFRYHALLFFLLPLGMCYGAYRAVLYGKYGAYPVKTWEKVFVVGAVFAIILFGVLRNLPFFAFLAPGAMA